MKQKAAEIGRVIQLVIAVLFMFTGIYFLDAGEEGGLLRYLAWLLFLAGVTNAIFNRVLTSNKAQLKLVISSVNVVLAAVIWFLFWKDEKHILSVVWAITGVFYALIAGYLLLFSKKETGEQKPQEKENRAESNF